MELAGRDVDVTELRHTLDLQELALRASAQLTAQPRPFLRWAGSKHRLLPQLVPFLPRQYGTYFEPFLGAGALFFLLQPTRAVLSDTCGPLIGTYEAVASKAGEVFDLVAQMDILDKDLYYRVRAAEPTDVLERAARFIYLNRAGWNGLYRVNNKGKFNVPYGRPKTGNTVDKDNLVACGKALTSSDIRILSEDFSHIEPHVRAGDFVYLDPPYVTGHNNNGFVDYNERLFSWADQVRLAQLAERLRQKGAHVVVSNAHHDAILDLYPNFNIAQVLRMSTLAGSASARKTVAEAVFHG